MSLRLGLTFGPSLCACTNSFRPMKVRLFSCALNAVENEDVVSGWKCVETMYTNQGLDIHQPTINAGPGVGKDQEFQQKGGPC